MTSRQPTGYRVVVLICLPPSLEKLCQEEELKDLLTEGTEEAERGSNHQQFAEFTLGFPSLKSFARH
jgi:hypothetical protein